MAAVCNQFALFILLQLNEVRLGFGLGSGIGWIHLAIIPMWDNGQMGGRTAWLSCSVPKIS